MPTFEGDTRVIFFVPSGVDICDAQGDAFREPNSPCTVPLPQIYLMLKGPIQEKFLELWSRETGLDPDQILFGAVPTAPADTASSKTEPFYPAQSFIAGPGRANREIYVRSRGHTINEKYETKKTIASLPIQPSDALWLLHKFLEYAYPDAGEVDAGNPNVFEGADCIWTRLLSFLHLPNFQYQPMKLHLRAVANTALEVRNTAGSDTALKIAIQLLRPGTTRIRNSVKLKNKETGKLIHVHRVTYTLSTNPPAATTLPPSIEPQLQSDDIMEEVEGDDSVQEDEEAGGEEVQVERTPSPDPGLQVPRTPECFGSSLGKRDRDGRKK